MEIWQIALVAACTVIVLIIALTASLGALVHGVVFSRQDKNPDFKYFTAEDFGLRCAELPVYLRGVDLFSQIYVDERVESNGKIVVFQHGFGAGSSSYMTEIAHFAKLGYTVVATDSCGCNNSGGKKTYGFYAGAEAVIATVLAIRREEKFKDKKIVLVGHSWGAYSVLCAARSVKVDGVVALSAFDAPAQCICDQMKLMSPLMRISAFVTHGWFYIFNLFVFGAKGNMRAAKAIDKSGVPALLIHGEKDRTVPLKHCALTKAKGKNVQKLALADKKHNPYNTVKAEEKLAELTAAHKFESEEERAKYFQSFDWAEATEEDRSVMEKIDEFIANA